jgi:heme/copper-type cytochrome/quinol oxidase subunit 2
MNIPPKMGCWLTTGALLLCAVTFSSTGSAQPADEVEAVPAEEELPVKTVKMTAENWKWTPKEIRVAQGTRLRLVFQSYDASHSFELKAYGIKLPLPEGKTGEIEFVVDKPGVFKWRCGRPCGDGCAKMRGKLIVE